MAMVERNLRKTLHLFFFLFLVFMQEACSVFDKEEPIPSYIRITGIDLKTPSDKSQGSSSSNITDAWVYINDNLQGVYPMPTRFPVLLSGSVKLSVRSGIVQNGIDATRIDYPFYNAWDTTVELKSKEILSLKPRIVGYKSGTVFHLNEDFESLGLNFEKTTSSTNDIYKTSNANLVFEGNNCGRFEILNGSIDVTIATTDYYNLPKQGAKVFLELNYNINQVMEVGVLALNGAQINQKSVIGLRATTNENGDGVWKKVYVDLTEAISSEIYASGYKIYFYAKQVEGNSNPLFLIDNVKIVSF
jgi:hypothetical protein